MMIEVPIFVASSLREFEDERKRFAEYLDKLNDAHRPDGVEIVWNRPEIMSDALYMGGHQNAYDRKIRESSFFVLIVGKKLGPYTEHEFEVARKRFIETSKNGEQGLPVILPYFLKVPPFDVVREQSKKVPVFIILLYCLNALPGMKDMKKVWEFRNRIRKDPDMGEQYVNLWENFHQILESLHTELVRHGAFRVRPATQSERDSLLSLFEELQDKFDELQDKIVRLDAQPSVTNTTLPYEESRPVPVTSQAESIELVLLQQQNLYDSTSSQPERNALENPKKETSDNEIATLQNEIAILQNELAICYAHQNQYEQSANSFHEALNIYQCLALENPSIYEPNLALTYKNLGRLERQRGDRDTARGYFEKSLSLYEKYPHCDKDAQRIRDALDKL